MIESTLEPPTQTSLIDSSARKAAPPDGERLFDCDYFRLSRLRGDSPFLLGAHGVPSLLVFIDGAGLMEGEGVEYSIGKGDVYLLPAAIKTCTCLPCDSALSAWEVSVPE